ncbi:MAG: PEGA domain-containing protein [Nitrospirae bacterium]|nr:PEGA domain-containing protein [Nitrospirota bacterium]
MHSYVGAEDYSVDIEKAISLYEKGAFDKAIGEFKQVINELNKRPDDNIRNEGLFTANLYIGMSYLGKGKENPAREYFKNAFMAAPHKTLNPELYPPKVISLYKEIISQNLSGITVKANIPIAKVVIDGIEKGMVPVIVNDLLPGMHTVKVTAGGQEVVKTITSEPGRDVSITADFQTGGTLSVISDPAGATVYLDGKAIGATPILIKDVFVGDHTISILKTGYIESTQKITVKADEITDMNLRLSRITFDVKVSSVPEKAEVFWDEAAKGETPFIIENVSTGLHRIRVVKEGYEEQEETIDVRTLLTEKTYRLTPYIGSLSVKTDPSAVDVIIDDKNYGTTPLKIDSIPAKQYIVKLKREGYVEKNISVTIAKDSMSEINEILLEIDTQEPEIRVEPLVKAVKENKNFIKAMIIDNQAVGEAALMLRIEGEINYQSIKMSGSSKGTYDTVIPDIYLKKGATLEYYVSACDLQNNCAESRSKGAPYKLKVISLEPYTEGFILDINSEKEKATISLGTIDGVKKGDKYVVFRTGKNLKDPKTGELLQIEEIFVGTIKVKELMPRTAYAAISDTDIPITKNDRIRKQVSVPAGVVTEGNSAKKITLRWTPNREPEVEGYRIFRSPKSDGNYQKIGEVDGRDNTLYEDNEDMAEGLTFYYKVAAFNIFGTNGLMSEPVVGKTKVGK